MKKALKIFGIAAGTIALCTLCAIGATDWQTPLEVAALTIITLGLFIIADRLINGKSKEERI